VATEGIQPPAKQESRAPTTREKWDLKGFIGDSLRPDEIDPQTSKRAKGPSVCGCGMAAHDAEHVTFHLRTRNAKARASVGGVYRCESARLCPTCALAVAAKRQKRVRSVVEATLLWFDDEELAPRPPEQKPWDEDDTGCVNSTEFCLGLAAARGASSESTVRVRCRQQQPQ
jgi:hypothetical protein